MDFVGFQLICLFLFESYRFAETVGFLRRKMRVLVPKLRLQVYRLQSWAIILTAVVEKAIWDV